jgi:hypothetical protein
MAVVNFVRGFYDVFIMKLDNNLLGAGQATNPNSLSTNTVLPPYRVEHPIEIGALEITSTVATDRGGTTLRGKDDMGVEDYGQLQLQFSDYDMTFHSIVSGSSINTTYNEGVTQGAPDALNNSLPLVAIWISAGRSSRDESNYGATGFFNRLMVGTIRASASAINQNGGVNPNPLTYQFTPTPVNKLFNGITFEALGVNYSSNENVFHDLNYDTYPVAIDTYVSDGAATAFTLTYRPVYSDATATGRNWFVRVPASAETGNNIAVDSVSTTTGEVDITSVSPLNTGDRIYVIYQTDDYVETS